MPRPGSKDVRTRPRGSGLAAVAVVVVLSMAGPVLLLASSRQGVHTTNDSFTYLGAASNLADGKGWTYPFRDVGAPVTLFPPMYSLVLAVPNLLGTDPLRWALWQNAVLFGVLSLLVGLTVLWSTQGSVGAAAAAVSLTVLGKPSILVFSEVWSETIFLSLAILALVFLARYVKAWRTRDLLLAGGAAGLAMLTRYAGLSVFVTGCLIIAGRSGRRVPARLRSLSIYAGVALALPVAWSVRNLLESRTLTGDNKLVHSLTASQVVQGFGTIGGWFFRTPLPGGLGLELVLLAALAALVVLLLSRVLRRGVLPRIRVPPLVIVCLVFSVVHFLFIVAANAFSSRMPPFNDRVLSPMYAPLVISLVLVGHAMWKDSPRFPASRGAVASTAVVLVAVAGLASMDSMPARFGAYGGSEEELLALSRSLDDSVSDGELALSNRANVAWFVLDRPVASLPSMCLANGTLPNPDYDSKLHALGRRLQGRPRVVFVFVHSTSCGPISVAKLESELGLVSKETVRQVLVLEGNPA